MDVPFQMVDRDQRLLQRECQRLCKTDPYEQRAGQARSLRHGERINALVSLVGIFEGLADHRHNRTQMLARGQLWHYSAVRSVGGELGKNNV